MEKLGAFIVFISVAIGILGAVHTYLWARLIRDTHLPAPWNTVALVALVTLALAIPAALFVGRAYPEWRRVLAWPAFIWLGVMFLLLVTLLATDLLRVIPALLGRLHDAGDTAVDPQRRTFLARAMGALVLALTAALGGLGARAALGPVEVRRVRVQLRRLPRQRDGFSLVQLTDMHVGPTRGRAFVEDVVRRANQLQPDIVAITGDLVDGTVADLRDAVAALGNLRARHGVYFVTGNHEYFSGAEPWLAELTRLGIRVLRNERVAIGHGADSFDLAGVDDYSAHRYGGLSHDDALAKALGGDRDPQRELILLAHQPRSIQKAAPLGVGLQLSGHTHGGQIWPFTYLVRLQQPFVAGLYQHGTAQIYVSRGTGYWGPPMRLGAPAEITHIVLERGEPPALAAT